MAPDPVLHWALRESSHETDILNVGWPMKLQWVQNINSLRHACLLVIISGTVGGGAHLVW